MKTTLGLLAKAFHLNLVSLVALLHINAFFFYCLHALVHSMHFFLLDVNVLYFLSVPCSISLTAACFILSKFRLIGCQFFLFQSAQKLFSCFVCFVLTANVQFTHASLLWNNSSSSLLILLSNNWLITDYHRTNWRGKLRGTQVDLHLDPCRRSTNGGRFTFWRSRSFPSNSWFRRPFDSLQRLQRNVDSKCTICWCPQYQQRVDGRVGRKRVSARFCGRSRSSPKSDYHKSTLGPGLWKKA